MIQQIFIFSRGREGGGGGAKDPLGPFQSTKAWTEYGDSRSWELPKEVDIV